MKLSDAIMTAIYESKVVLNDAEETKLVQAIITRVRPFVHLESPRKVLKARPMTTVPNLPAKRIGGKKVA